LYEAASTTKELARMWGDTVTYTHIIREYNTVADDMVRRARDNMNTIQFIPSMLPTNAPKFDGNDVYSYLN
jgi:hypothetical protein